MRQETLLPSGETLIVNDNRQEWRRKLKERDGDTLRVDLYSHGGKHLSPPRGAFVAPSEPDREIMAKINAAVMAASEQYRVGLAIADFRNIEKRMLAGLGRGKIWSEGMIHDLAIFGVPAEPTAKQLNAKANQRRRGLGQRGRVWKG